MDKLDFVIRLVSATIWPVTAVLLAVILRYPVQNLLVRLRSGEFPGVKLSFDAGPDTSAIAAAERFEYECIPSVSKELEIDQGVFDGAIAWGVTEMVNHVRSAAEASLAPAL